MKSIIDKNNYLYDTIKYSKLVGFQPQHHLEALIMKKEEKEEPWYVVVTEENQKICSEWRGYKVGTNQIVGMCLWNNNKISKETNPKSCIKCEDYDFGKEISTQEFYRRIGKLKSTNYEIYY